MKTLVRIGIVAILLHASVPSVGRAQGRLIIMSFSNAPISQVLEFYSDLTGSPVVLDDGYFPTITLRTPSRVTESEALAMITSCLTSNGVTMTVSSSVVRVSVAGSPGGASRTISSPRPIVKRDEVANRPANPTNKLEGEALAGALKEYEEAVIRAGLPPLGKPAEQ